VHGEETEEDGLWEGRGRRRGLVEWMNKGWAAPAHVLWPSSNPLFILLCSALQQSDTLNEV
jgi:hypothetical protein